MTNHAATMYDYHVWANKTMLERLKELPREVYEQEIQSSISSIAKTMSHIYLVDRCWLDVLSGNSMGEALNLSHQMTEQIDAKSMEELEGLFNDVSQGYYDFIRQHEDLEQTLVLDNPYAGVRDTRFSEILLQVANHGTYHRGNITTMLRVAGHPSVMTEYALYWYAKSFA
jgi:uncharacterized damage-inducible protein DinB